MYIFGRYCRPSCQLISIISVNINHLSNSVYTSNIVVFIMHYCYCMLLLHAFFPLLYFYNVSSYSAIQPQVCNKLSVQCVQCSSQRDGQADR